MNKSNVIVVRIYLHEAGARQDKLLEYLHNECKVRGVTVFRGVAGYGATGKYHSSTLMDLSLDLPLVIEFFDFEEKVKIILEQLNTMITPGHLVYWPAKMNIENEP